MPAEFHLSVIDPASPATAGSAVDIEALRIGSFRLTKVHNEPATLTFVMHLPAGLANQATLHNLDLPTGGGLSVDDYIKFWDADGAASSEAAPLFLGRIDDITPEGSSMVKFTCLDASAVELTMFEDDWVDTVTPGARSYPRVVYNGDAIQNDDDAMWSLLQDATVGEILDHVCDQNKVALRGVALAPSAGVSLDTAQTALLDFEPQEKLVFETETFVSILSRTLGSWYPQVRMVYDPTAYRFKLVDITATTGAMAMTTKTVTLNDRGAAHPILTAQINRTTAGRFTAVEFYGPQSAESVDVTVSGGGLTEFDSGVTVDTTVTPNITGRSKWQITDATKRRVLRWLPDWFGAPQPGAVQTSRVFGSSILSFVETPTRSPVFMVKFPSRPNSSWSNVDHWITVEGWSLDPQNGIIEFKDGRYVHLYDPKPPSGKPRWLNPSDARFVYATPAEPLTARYPTTGHAGTAYSVAGIERTLRIYDEQLAVEIEYYKAVTTTQRTDAFKALAENLHKLYSDIGYTGVITLQGIDYSYIGMNILLNITAEDESGSALTTGLEAAKAVVTEVEYDYDEDTTTITLNSDLLDLIGEDQKAMKERLKIRDLTRFTQLVGAQNTFTPFTRKDFLGRSVQLFAHNMEMTYASGFVDERTGETQGVQFRVEKV
jgi:hypothetical protein